MEILVKLDSYNLVKSQYKIAQHLIDSEIGLTKSKLASMLGVNLRTIFRWQSDGLIKLNEKRGKTTFNEDDAIALLQDKGYSIFKK